ncbi:hypothetical protein FOL47_007418 [Perkinsus chesapeaki]|uniref:Uncharacterized protein n=1 Tax=Perkinsus chesapeaki TaxID=330153 RepID=A0A7J6LKH8_PERCH|nr:hypothetical protein FOL47_007418 [Perkinsus chesapeaki]
MPSASSLSSLSTELSCSALRRELGGSEHLDILDNNLRELEAYVIDRHVPLDNSPGFTGRDCVPRRDQQFLFSSTDSTTDQQRIFIPEVIRAAISLEDSEVLNGFVLPHSEQLLRLRDRLLLAYNDLRQRLAAYASGSSAKIGIKYISDTWQAWVDFERAWLHEKESHVVTSFQPLVNIMLAVEPFVRSRERERLLPFPRCEKQKVNSVMLLEGICSALPALTAVLVPVVDRCLFFDPVLLLVAEYVQNALHGTISHEDSDERSLAQSIAEECCTTAAMPPERPDSTGSVWSGLGKPINGAARRRMSCSMGEQGFVTLLAGLSGADLTLLRSGGVSLMGCCQKTGALQEYAFKVIGPVRRRGTTDKLEMPPRTSDGIRRAERLTGGLLRSFDQLVDTLLSMKTTLEIIPANLLEHPRLPRAVVAFNAIYRRTARLYMEPDNLL